MSEEEIIEQIKLNPVLYNPKVTEYRDKVIRDIVWQIIALNVNTDVNEVKAKWIKLRNCYTNALKRRHKRKNKESKKFVQWKFEKQMEFLTPYLRNKDKK